MVACSGLLSGLRLLKRGNRSPTPLPSASSTRPAAAVCCRDSVISANDISKTSLGLNQIGGDSLVITNAEDGRLGKQFILSCISSMSLLEFWTELSYLPSSSSSSSSSSSPLPSSSPASALGPSPLSLMLLLATSRSEGYGFPKIMPSR